MDRYPGTLELGGLTKKRYEDVIKPTNNDEVVWFVVTVSKTANNSVKNNFFKYYKILQPKELLNDYEYWIITAYYKHKIELVPWFLAKCKKMLYQTMSPGALIRLSINTSPVKQLKPNYKILNPSNYFSETKPYFLK